MIAILASTFLLSLACLAKTVQASPIHDAYDFIIIGGGTSGLTVANRLTENRHVQVLVVERGPFDDGEPSVLVPGLLNLTSTPYWYNLTSTPQRHLDNRSFQVPVAKVVGGGTIINGMLMQRAASADYDAWRDLGNPSWGWDDLLPFFKKSETFTPPDPKLAAEYPITYNCSTRGEDGPVDISYPVFQYPGAPPFYSAWEALGISPPEDPASGKVIGPNYGPGDLNPRNQSRDSARTAYYDPISARPNLEVLVEHVVTKINFDEAKRALGVDLVSLKNRSSPKTIRASKEVVLAAGVHSPQILQLSGIGPARLLKEKGILEVVDLPGVGSNLQDHATLYSAVNFTNNFPRPDAQDLIDNTTYANDQLKLYYASRQGAYTLTAESGNVVAYISLDQLTNDTKRIISVAKQTYPALAELPSPEVARGFKRQQELFIKLLQDPNEPVWECAYSTLPSDPNVNVRPLSRGSINIASANIFDEPLFDWNTFSHPVDLEILVATVHRFRDLLNTPPFAQYGPVELVPGANLTTDDELRREIQKIAAPTFSHPCCTNPMMPRELGGVVDSELQVYGTKGLRVVDASVMPIIPSSHLTLPVYAVAEKAADLIKARYQL